MASSGEYKSHFKEYMIVFAVLAFFTFIELFIPELDVAYVHKIWSLTLIAVAKALIVAYFYMHLKEETKWMKFIAAIPISAAIYAVALIAESMYR